MRCRSARSLSVLILILMATACGSIESALFGDDDKDAEPIEVEAPLIEPVEYEVEVKVEGELDPELRLADAGGAEQDGERAGHKPAAEEVVEPVDAGGESRGVVHLEHVGHHAAVDYEARAGDVAAGLAGKK